MPGRLPTPALGPLWWETRFRRWPKGRTGDDGYTLLLPVPGDIPAFLEFALAACAAQASGNRRETLVIPDRPTPAVAEIVRRHAPYWDGPLRIQPLPLPERWLLPLMKSGSRNHAVQLIAGTVASTTSHILLHDADLFPSDDGLFERQYAACRDRNLSCFGLTGVWDPWFQQKGLRLAATWELVARVDWLRSFPPFQHMGHDATLWGERHTFDTTLLPQALTPPEKVDHTRGAEGSFVHLNYTITTYRMFQHRKGAFLDDRFLMLFISTVSTLFGIREDDDPLPSTTALARDLATATGPVRFPAPAQGVTAYAKFRDQLGLLLENPWVPSKSLDEVRQAIARFDDYYR